MITYYRSRSESQPIVYAEEDGGWKSYSPSGIIQKNTGPLPNYIRLSVDQVPFAEVVDLIRASEAEAARKDHEARLPPPVSGLGGWLRWPIVGLYFAILGSLYYVATELPGLWGNWDNFTNPESSAYHPLFGPFFGFYSFVDFFLVLAPIALLWLIYKKKRILPQTIVYYYAFVLFAMVIIFVGISTFIYQFLAERGFAEEASKFMTDGAIDIIWRGLLTCGIWTPYFLYSKRVRNTFTEPLFADRRFGAEADARRSVIASLAAESRARAQGVDAAPEAVEDAAVVDAEVEDAAVEDAAVEPPPVGPVYQPAPPPGWRAPTDKARPRPKILMIPVIGVLVIVLGVVIALTAWRDANPPVLDNPVTVSTDAMGNKSKHYSNEDEGFSFDYPGTWVLDANQNAGVEGYQLLVFDPDGKKIDNEAIDSFAIVVLRPGVEPTMAELRASVSINFDSLAAAEGWQSITSWSDITVSGLTGITATYEIPAPNGEMVVSPIYYLVSGDRVFYLQLFYSKETSGNAKPKLEQILRSFKATP